MLIHRTIFKELLKNLMVIIASLSIILFMEKFIHLTRIFMGKGAELVDIAKIFLYLQPSILLLSVPMTIMISIFLTYGRMASDSETILLKATGMSFAGISKVAVMLSLLCFIALLFTSLYLLPRSMNAFKRTIHETIMKKASMTLEAGSFSDVFEDTVIFVNDITAKSELEGIFVYRQADKTVNEPFVITAEKGAISSNPQEGLIKLSMDNGFIHTYTQKSSSEVSFSSYDLILTSGIENSKKIRPEEINTLRLWENQGNKKAWTIELNRRVALPFACLIFGMLGPAMSNRMGKIGRLGGFSVSLALLILYYMLLVTGEGLAKSGKIGPFWGMWTPNLVFLVLAALLFYISHKDRPLKRY